MLQARQPLIAQTCPVMHDLSGKIRASDGIVMLADRCGIVLCSLGDDIFTERAASVALRAGANWNERWRGTNAIGAVIATGDPMAVDGMEHYLSCNAFLSCAAAPVRDPWGQLVAVLNVSGRRGRLPLHTLSMVCTAARQIEQGLFMASFVGNNILRLHPFLEGLGGPNDGLLALSEDEIVIGADHMARSLLSLADAEIGHVCAEEVIGEALHTASDQLLQPMTPLRPTRSGHLGTLYGSVYRGRGHALHTPLLRVMDQAQMGTWASTSFDMLDTASLCSID